jgi:hypothetical protein
MNPNPDAPALSLLSIVIPAPGNGAAHLAESTYPP